eukprot:TRINITY_DN2329_c0_g1_i1.p1 TRINITY_DN2329_c0_g1~~TRINITY_DN2329_c0_g1_i1.p1  ORF type:complete len:1416 (-),score=301.38 TRINITY_DN2329_c0_g1_i1:218-4465(-)
MSGSFSFGSTTPIWVELTVVGAHGVTDKDRCKLYCVVEQQLSDLLMRTKAKKMKEPQWDQRFILDVSKDRFVKLSVWDKETFGKDEFLGEVTFEISKLLTTPSSNLTIRSAAAIKDTQIFRFSLHNRKGGFGSVQGEITVNYKLASGEKEEQSPDLKRLKRRAKRKANTPNRKRKLKLDYSNSRLKETLPEFLGEISAEWTHLNLSFNYFPSAPDLDRFKSLRYLDLSYNYLSNLEPAITTMTTLKYLNLGYNALTGLPPSFANLTKLKQLNLKHNKISVLGGEIGKLVRLEELVLYGNPLVLIAPEIGDCSNLQVLDICCCRLLGLPDEIGNLSKLTELNLTVNNLAELPPTIGKLTNLMTLHLSYNQLSDLPDALGDCKALGSLTIEGGNQFGDAEIITKFRQGPQALIEHLSSRKEASRKAVLPPSAFKSRSTTMEPEIQQSKIERRKSRLSWAVFGGSSEEREHTPREKPLRQSLEVNQVLSDSRRKRLSVRLMGALGIEEKPIQPFLVQQGDKGHHFIKAQFYGQVPCAICHKTIWGIGNAACECSACQMPAHKKCAEKAPLNCGTAEVRSAAVTKNTNRRSLFVHNLENELKGQQVVKKNANEGTAKDPTFLFLSQACKLGDSGLLRRLLFETKQSKLEHLRIQHNTDSNTPIHLACYFGHVECIKLLLEKDADLINCRNGAGMTPLHTAAKVGKEECLAILIEKGADVNVRDYTEGATALHHASERGKLGCVKLLLSKGANSALTNAKGKTALDKALLRGYTEIAVLLGYVPKTSVVEEGEITLFGLEKEDHLAWLRKKLLFITDMFELLTADFNLFDINGDGEIEVGELTNQLEKQSGDIQSIGSKLLDFINKANDPNLVIDVNKFIWLIYNLVAMNQEDKGLGKDEKLIREGFHVLQKCFERMEEGEAQPGIVSKQRFAQFLADLNGVALVDVQNQLTYEKSWRFLENVKEIDFQLYLTVMRQWTIAEVLDLEVQIEGEQKKSHFKILDTISLTPLTKALRQEFDFPDVEIFFVRPGTNNHQPIKKNRDLETAIVSFKSKRSSKTTRLRLFVKKIAEKPMEAPSLRAPMPKPKMLFSLDVKKAEESALPPIVHYLKNPEREKASWEVSADEIEFGKMIGRGAYGEVYEGKFRGKRVAIKKLLGTIRQEDVFKSFVKEIEFLAKFKNPHVLEFHAACLEHPNLCVVTDFMDRGTVNDVVTKENVEWKRIVNMAIDAAKGLQYMHENKILHKDIKSFNFLVANDYRVVIADFGCSEEIDPNDNKAGLLGTFNWMPPEAFDPGVYDTKSDIFSYGMVLWEMLTAQIPYGTVNNQLMVLQLIDSAERPHIPAAAPETFANLIRACWDASPEKRPDWNEIITTLESLLPSQPSPKLLLKLDGCPVVCEGDVLVPTTTAESLEVVVNAVNAT